MASAQPPTVNPRGAPPGLAAGRRLSVLGALGVLLIVAALVGCAEASPDARPPHVQAQVSEHPFREANATCFARPPPPSDDRVALVPAFAHLNASGASFTKLTHLIQVGPQEFYASLLGGQVRAFSSDPARPEVRTVLDLAGRVDLSYGENGLVSLAAHPDFANNGWLFAVYSVPHPTAGHFVSRLGRFTRSADGTFSPSSELVILDVEQLRGTHSGNHIVFGPEGALYYSLGDDLQNQLANPNITTNAAQSLDSPKGKVLRLDVDRSGEGLVYSAPPTNPYAAAGGIRSLVWALGFRNPWRFSVASDGRVFLGDVGQDTQEELDEVVAGGNYGWPLLEGQRCHVQSACESAAPDGGSDGGSADSPFIGPLSYYTVGQPKAIVAGPLVEDPQLPQLQGRVLYGDYIAGHIWSLDPASPEPRLELEGSFPLVSFATGWAGEVYALRFSGDGQGAILRLVTAPAPAASDFPLRLSQTGCVDPADPTRPAQGLVAFEPAAALWSDGAQKERYFAIPDTTRLVAGPDGHLEFPDGAVVMKHFAMEGAAAHETRLLMRYNGEWRGYSYRWNAQGTDAELLSSGLAVTLPSGVHWSYPSRAQCNACHTPEAGFTLGLEVGQLRKARAGHAMPQVQRLVVDGWLAPPDPGVDWLAVGEGHLPLRAVPELVEPFGDASLDARARSYLHVNCQSCHRPGVAGRAALDLRANTPLAETGLCDQEPRTTRLWDTPYNNWDQQRLLVPGRAQDSIVWLRLTTPGLFRMPILGTELVHAQAADLVEAWIAGMDGCTPPPQ